MLSRVRRLRALERFKERREWFLRMLRRRFKNMRIHKRRLRSMSQRKERIVGRYPERSHSGKLRKKGLE